jgi:hypothetical protein
MVFAHSEWNLGQTEAVEDLNGKLSKRALTLYPKAELLLNFKWKHGDGYHGHTWFDGSADVYIPDA